ALTAVRVAAGILADTDRQVGLLYVAPESPLAKSAASAGHEYADRLTRDTARILRRTRHTLPAEGIDAPPRCRSGPTGTILLEEAEKYDFTVVGAKGRETRSDVGLGPVASRLVEHAAGCVLVGRELRGEKGIRVLVPVDGSGASDQALAAVSSMIDLPSA